MKVTKNFITKFVKCLNNSSQLTAYNVRIEDSEETIIRYEDINNVTHSIYFTSDECMTGYIVGGIYKWFSTKKLSAYDDSTMFLFDLGITLTRQWEYVSDYVLE